MTQPMPPQWTAEDEADHIISAEYLATIDEAKTAIAGRLTNAHTVDRADGSVSGALFTTHDTGGIHARAYVAGWGERDDADDAVLRWSTETPET